MPPHDMPTYDAATYGDRVAAVYDDWHAQMGAHTEAAVAFLAELAGRGRMPAIPMAANGHYRRVRHAGTITRMLRRLPP